MLKKEIKSHFGIAFIWLAGVSLLRLFTGQQIASFLFFWLGALLGTILFDADHLLDVLFVHPVWPTTKKVKELLVQHRWRAMLKLLAATYEERTRLAFHNALFQIIFWIFCFWVLTSTGSWLGKGLVMGMSLHLLKDEFHLLLKNRDEQLRGWLWWPLSRPVSLRFQRHFVILALLLFLGLNLLLI